MGTWSSVIRTAEAHHQKDKVPKKTRKRGPDEAMPQKHNITASLLPAVNFAPLSSPVSATPDRSIQCNPGTPTTPIALLPKLKSVATLYHHRGCFVANAPASSTTPSPLSAQHQVKIIVVSEKSHIQKEIHQKEATTNVNKRKTKHGYKSML